MRRLPGKHDRMPIVRPCSYPGCETLTMGRRCLEHEAPRAAWSGARGHEAVVQLAQRPRAVETADMQGRQAPALEVHRAAFE